MKRKVKREWVEWMILLTIVGVVYVGGWHTEVIGRMQQVMLSTGIFSPNYTYDHKIASYNFWLEDANGNRVHFSKFKGKVVFMNFWATWCPPCVAEMPDIHRLYEEKKTDVAFVLISLDQEEEKAQAFVQRKEFTFPIYYLRSGLPPTYSTYSIPTTYVMDKEGLIKVENHGMAKYNTKRFKNMLDDLTKAE